MRRNDPMLASGAPFRSTPVSASAAGSVFAAPPQVLIAEDLRSRPLPHAGSTPAARRSKSVKSELVVEAQAGDMAAYEQLARSFYDDLHDLAFRILRARPAAEDAVQQVVVEIWQHLPRLRDPAHFEGWSVRLLIEACDVQARRERQRASRVNGRDRSEPNAPSGLDAGIDRDRVEDALRALAVNERAIIVLYYHLDQPVERVAATLSRSLHVTVRGESHGAGFGCARGVLVRFLETLQTEDLPELSASCTSQPVTFLTP